MYTGVQTYSSWSVPQRCLEDKHGSHTHMLPPLGMSGGCAIMSPCGPPHEHSTMAVSHAACRFIV
jgi:hypothetical protein